MRRPAARAIVGEMDTRSTAAHDQALTCLAELAVVSGDLHRQISEFSQWALAANQQAPGVTYADVLTLEKRVVITERISEAIKVLSREGNRFRRLEARALYEEGLTMAQLAAVFGVSRQRVSTLLREAGAQPGTAFEE